MNFRGLSMGFSIDSLCPSTLLRNIAMLPYWRLVYLFLASWFRGSAAMTYPCDACGRQYRRVISLQRHKRLECGKEATFQCILCQSRFKHKHSLIRHFNVHVPENENAITSLSQLQKFVWQMDDEFIVTSLMRLWKKLLEKMYSLYENWEKKVKSIVLYIINEYG